MSALSSKPDDGSGSSVRALHDGLDVLIGQAKIIAMLPLEEWLRAFDRAEALAPILDPTLYRDYIYDPERKGEAIKDIIRAALPLKREILKLQARFNRAATPGPRKTETANGE